MRVDPCASETLALRIAHNSYRKVDDCRRPVASAGGLEPIHLLTVGAQAAGGLRRVLVTSDDGTVCHELARLATDALLAMFVDDQVIVEPIDDGAAVVIICADPRGSVQKYGDRGWRYALLEAGAVSHHMALLAAAEGAHCRPVGGFLDAPMASLADGLIPLLAVVIAVEPASGDSTCA